MRIDDYSVLACLHQCSGDLHHAFVSLIAILPIPIALPASNAAISLSTHGNEGHICGTCLIHDISLRARCFSLGSTRQFALFARPCGCISTYSGGTPPEYVASDSRSAGIGIDCPHLPCRRDHPGTNKYLHEVQNSINVTATP